MSTKLKAGTATSGAVLDADTTGILELQSGSTPTTAITLNTAQDVLINGTTAIDGGVGVQVGNTSAGNAKSTLQLLGNTNSWIQFGNGLSGASRYLGWVQYNYASNYMTFATNSTERMRLDASGNVLVGTTGISTGTFKGIQNGVNSGGFGNYLSQNPAGTSTRQWSFGMNNSDQYVVYGYNNTSFNTGAYIAWGGTSWTASSDERLKDIIEPITNGLEKVSTLRAVIGKYKTDEEGTRRSFLIAQDVQTVFPEAVDASNPDNLGVQYTEVIPLLVASIKELNEDLAATKLMFADVSNKVDAQALEIQALKGTV